MALSIEQLVGDGVTVDFPFTFKIATDTLLDVYKTLAGATANEVIDLLPNTEYTLVLNPPINNFSDGKVTFNVAPAIEDIVTLTPEPDASIDIDFTAAGQLNPDNLNKAFAEHTTPIDFSFGLYQDRTTRYTINVKESDIAYSPLLPALPAEAFWRRNATTTGQPGAGFIAQGFDDFVQEVAVATSQASGLLEEIDEAATAGQTVFKLVSGSPLTPWIGVTLEALVVHVNGLRFPQEGAYTVQIQTSPTLAAPSTLTFITPLILNDAVLIDRPAPTISTTLMTVNSNNALFDATSRVPDRALGNVTGVDKAALAPLIGNTANTVSTLVARDASGFINVTKVVTTDMRLNNTITTAAQPLIILADTNGDLLKQDISVFEKDKVIQTALAPSGVFQQISNAVEGGNRLIVPNTTAAPTIAQGGEVASLLFTPKKANSVLHLSFNSSGCMSNPGNYIVMIFRNSDSTLLGSAADAVNLGNDLCMQTLHTQITLASAAAETYSVRIGLIDDFTFFFLGRNGIAPIEDSYGGSLKSTFKIEEISQ